VRVGVSFFQIRLRDSRCFQFGITKVDNQRSMSLE